MSQTASRRELRSFGLLVGGVFSIIGFWPLIVRGESLRIWALALGASLIVPGVLFPSVLRPIHKWWMRVGHVLGWINTRILLGLVFYGLITPMGLFFRLIGKDSMSQNFSESSTTYRVNRQPRPRSHMKHQF